MKSDEIIEKIRKKLLDSDPEKRTVKHIFQFEFTETDGKCIKKMVFDFDALNIYEGVYEKAVATIKICDEDFYLMGTRQTTFEDLLNEKKAEFSGDSEALSKMMDKFRMNQKKE